MPSYISWKHELGVNKIKSKLLCFKIIGHHARFSHELWCYVLYYPRFCFSLAWLKLPLGHLFCFIKKSIKWWKCISHYYMKRKAYINKRMFVRKTEPQQEKNPQLSLANSVNIILNCMEPLIRREQKLSGVKLVFKNKCISLWMEADNGKFICIS